jgi:hypothetical protein
MPGPNSPFPVLPPPQKIRLTGAHFDIDDRVVVVAASGRANDLALARRVSNEIADITRIGVPVAKGTAPEGSRPIYIAKVASRGWPADEGQRLRVTKSDPGPEGYALDVTPGKVSIIGSDHAGALYGGSTLLSLIRSDGARFRVEGARVRDWPYKPVRGVHVFVPGKEDLPYFKRYMERFLLRYKYNTLFLECSGGMRLHRNQEISAGWAWTVDELYAHGETVWETREGCPLGPKRRFQSTPHRGTAGGEYIEQRDVADICDLARGWNIDVIPEVQSLSHVYYIATPRRDLAELPDALFPEAYCPSNPESYRLIRDIFDEYIEVTGCRGLHIGHDEWRVQASCPRCKGKHTGDLFARDVIKLWKHLTRRDVDLWMWSDHFVPEHNEKGRVLPESGAVWYDYPSTEGARDRVAEVSRDRPISLTHWSWGYGPQTDELLHEAGFRVTYGNMSPDALAPQWKQRSSKPWILGGEVSSWCRADAFELGQMHVPAAVRAAALLWSGPVADYEALHAASLAQLPAVHSRLAASPLPSIASPNPRHLGVLDLSQACNAPLRGEGWDLSLLSGAKGTVGRVPYLFGRGKRASVVVRRPDDRRSKAPREVRIDAGTHVQGLVFWHTLSGRAGLTVHAGDQTYFPREASDLTAVYEIQFVDGRTHVVECRAESTIDVWDASLRASRYHAPYHLVGPALPDGRPVVILGHEWHNPRPDIEIHSILMKGCRSRAYEIQRHTPLTILLGVSRVNKPQLKDYRSKIPSR